MTAKHVGHYVCARSHPVVLIYLGAALCRMFEGIVICLEQVFLLQIVVRGVARQATDIALSVILHYRIGVAFSASGTDLIG